MREPQSRRDLPDEVSSSDGAGCSAAPDAGMSQLTDAGNAGSNHLLEGPVAGRVMVAWISEDDAF